MIDCVACARIHVYMNLDRAGPNTAMHGFLEYNIGLNITCEWDIAHDEKRVGAQALKRAKLYNTAVVLTSAVNCVYGCALSPPIMDKIRQSVHTYMDEHGPDGEWFQLHLPHIAQQLGLQADINTPEGVQAASNVHCCMVLLSIIYDSHRSVDE